VPSYQCETQRTLQFIYPKRNFDRDFTVSRIGRLQSRSIPKPHFLIYAKKKKSLLAQKGGEINLVTEIQDVPISLPKFQTGILRGRPWPMAFAISRSNNEKRGPSSIQAGYVHIETSDPGSSGYRRHMILLTSNSCSPVHHIRDMEREKWISLTWVFTCRLTTTKKETLKKTQTPRR